MEVSNILVVDDSRTVRSSLQKQLEHMGAVVTLAVNGQEGFAAAVSNSFDLIISDVEMPVMDGFSLCRMLKGHPATRAVPVVILSTLDQEEDIDLGFEAGASAYVVKHRANRELIPRVMEILSRASLLRDRLLMIVDDSRLIRSTISESLLQAGFRVITAENGSQALELLKTHTPDVILSDINMPVMSGAEFCEAVRSMERLSHVPFVAMSSESDRRIMREMVQWGASAYLIKPFHPEQLIILAEKLLSDHVQILLQEKRLLVAERSSLLSSISSLIQALEARDVYTRGHSEAVADIAQGIGRKLGLGPQEIEKLWLAGKLHDIGKIGIRDDILLKPGKLSQDEFETIKTHPRIGAEILSPISSMGELVPSILHHHEKLDGHGYPSGLKGDSIPLFARIIAVGDVFHALTSKRPYRQAITPDEGLAVIAEASGTHLCPVCVRAFMASRKD
jgi:response regulator RpfG family c-di-GMP phosphodiesterase